MVYWLISVRCPPAQAESLWASVQTDLRGAGFGSMTKFRFEVPTHFKIGSLDSLVSLADDLGKLDHQLEALTKKAERQLKELDPNAELTVNRPNLNVFDSYRPRAYVSQFAWNNAKFPAAKSLPELAALIQEKLSQLDTDVKKKGQEYLDAKSALDAYLKKEGGNLTVRDLGEVLTPAVARHEDFVNSDHLQTLLVVVPEKDAQRFPQAYEQLSQWVVPRSTKQFRVEDRDGFTLWRMVVWKSAVSDIQAACRNEKWVAREFEYHADYLTKQAASREELRKAYEDTSRKLLKTCKEVFSELYICLMHLKAIRLFVESVLRYSLPPTFLAFGLEPEEGRERKLEDVLVRKFLREGESVDLYVRTDQDEGEDFFPYVMIPINVVVG